MRTCERCGAQEVFSNDPKRRLHVGYCVKCSKNLCDPCIQKGCCGSVPAVDGEAEEAGE